MRARSFSLGVVCLAGTAGLSVWASLKETRPAAPPRPPSPQSGSMVAEAPIAFSIGQLDYVPPCSLGLESAVEKGTVWMERRHAAPPQSQPWQADRGILNGYLSPFGDSMAWVPRPGFRPSPDDSMIPRGHAGDLGDDMAWTPPDSLPPGVPPEGSVAGEINGIRYYIMLLGQGGG